MKTYQREIISAIKEDLYLGGKVREFHPQKDKYLKLIDDIKNERKTKVPKKFLDRAVKMSKSEYTKNKIKSVNKFNIVKERVKYFYANKRNLRIIYIDTNFDEKIVEKWLKNQKYTYSQLYDIALDNMNKLNAVNKSKYRAPLMSIVDFYIVERWK